jgi:hypothetical protein
MAVKGQFLNPLQDGACPRCPSRTSSFLSLLPWDQADVPAPLPTSQFASLTPFHGLHQTGPGWGHRQVRAMDRGPWLPAGCAPPSGRPQPAPAARPRSGPRGPWPEGGSRNSVATADRTHAQLPGAPTPGHSTYSTAAPGGTRGQGHMGR